jgi:hypothetical protein
MDDLSREIYPLLERDCPRWTAGERRRRHPAYWVLSRYRDAYVVSSGRADGAKVVVRADEELFVGRTWAACYDKIDELLV